jgi:hypothetical protein
LFIPGNPDFSGNKLYLPKDWFTMKDTIDSLHQEYINFRGGAVARGAIVTGSTGRGRSVSMNSYIASLVVSFKHDIVIQLADDELIYINGDTRVAELYKPHATPVHVSNSLNRRETVYFFDPMQEQGRAQPSPCRAFTIIPAPPNSKNWFCVRKSGLRYLYLYDLSHEEFTAIARDMHPERFPEDSNELDLFIKKYGTNLRCLESTDFANFFHAKLEGACRNVTVQDLVSLSIDYYGVVEENNIFHTLYGYRRPNGAADDCITEEELFCNTDLSREAHEELSRRITTEERERLLKYSGTMPVFSGVFQIFIGDDERVGVH